MEAEEEEEGEEGEEEGRDFPRSKDSESQDPVSLPIPLLLNAARSLPHMRYAP